jgi:hypothetical protein
MLYLSIYNSVLPVHSCQAIFETPLNIFAEIGGGMKLLLGSPSGKLRRKMLKATKIPQSGLHIPALPTPHNVDSTVVMKKSIRREFLRGWLSTNYFSFASRWDKMLSRLGSGSNVLPEVFSLRGDCFSSIVLRPRMCTKNWCSRAYAHRRFVWWVPRRRPAYVRRMSSLSSRCMNLQRSLRRPERIGRHLLNVQTG